MAATNTIPANQAWGTFREALLATYVDKVEPKSFLRSFFRAQLSLTKVLTIAVQRGKESIAVDVQRGTEGNRNKFSKETVKQFIPPLYHEYFDVTELDLYDRMFAPGGVDAGMFAEFLFSVTQKTDAMRAKINRGYELQAAQVFDTGVVELNATTNIDFKRKSASKVDGSSTPWSTDTNDPYADLLAAATFLRETGKIGGSTINIIMGSAAYEAFTNNAIVKARADIRNYSLDAITAPQRNAVGASLQGVVSAGAYSFVIWTYPEIYTNAAGTNVKYVDDKKFVALPQTTQFDFGYAAVPQLLAAGGQILQQTEFFLQDFPDPKLATHEYHLKSAGLAIPTAVDQIYTRQVLA